MKTRLTKLTISCGAVLFSAVTLYADNAPAKTGVLLSVEGSSSVILQTETQSIAGIDIYKSEQDNGLGLGAYIAFDYALTRNVTIGAKTGYFHVFDIAKVTVGSSSTKISTDNIPLLATAKYHFDSGWFVGGEMGLDLQRASSTDSNIVNSTGKWGVAFMAGPVGGYKWDNLSISGSLDYISGDDLSFQNTQNDGLNTLQNIKLG
ncbi:hypothetical protein, partial [Fangia hongkongensis]